jgi:phosphatidylserine/phosphatidylglycerophosphate/cardiolipin synthase-like enzyme
VVESLGMKYKAEDTINGSFNFTQAAEEKNAENLLIMKGNRQLIDAYIKNFNEHKGHSEVYVGRMNK